MKHETICIDKVTLISDGATLLNGITLRIFRGEIMGLISVNAYGLDALIRLLCRNIPIHYGRVYFEGSLVNSYKRSSMSRNGVALVEGFGLVEDLTVADNIFVLRDGYKKLLVRPEELERRLKAMTDKLGVSIEASAPVSSLTPLERCIVEILGAVMAGARLVVLRNIEAEISALHGFIRRCAARGIAFLYISGRHEDIRLLAKLSPKC